MTKVNLKTPISYYGGKQTMLKHILPMLPKHEIYVEPFFGGGAVFWAKEQKEIEIINDCNGMVVNFYEQLKSNFSELKRVIEATPFSRDVYKKAMVVYENPYIFTPLVKAWAFWVCTNQGFSNLIGSWRSSQISRKDAMLIENKKLAFTKDLSDRLKTTQIEHIDAVKLIKRADLPETFFYIDPPYVGAVQGHYGGYLQEHFDNLLNALSTLKGKFLLSSYPNENLLKFRKKFGWRSNDADMHLSVSNKGKRKVECLTFNYDLKSV